MRQQLRVAGHCAQRLLQVVGRHVSERLQLFVRALQLGGALLGSRGAFGDSFFQRGVQRPQLGFDALAIGDVAEHRQRSPLGTGLVAQGIGRHADPATLGTWAERMYSS